MSTYEIQWRKDNGTPNQGALRTSRVDMGPYPLTVEGAQALVAGVVGTEPHLVRVVKVTATGRQVSSEELCDCPNDARKVREVCSDQCKHVRPWGTGRSLYERYTRQQRV